MNAAMKSRSSLTAFNTHWCAADYLGDYYSTVEQDERITLRFLCTVASRLPVTGPLLDFGCGPTVHHLLPFAGRTTEFHLADYLPENLEAVRQWRDHADSSHDWSEFAEYVLACESGKPPQPADVQDRLERTRANIKVLLHGDARQADPLGASIPRGYSAVLCCFCPDSITTDPVEWHRYMLNIAGLVAPGGWLAVAALGRANGYTVGNHRFPSSGVRVADVCRVFSEARFCANLTQIWSEPAEEVSRHGFSEVVLALAQRE
jgi:hypothetical protein